ncbi:MAG: CBS domain-containing protein [Bacteroidia bacterium]|nr:CBS domain-containing protein [Bacteroidia bacterium]
MLAKDLMSEIIPALRTSDTGLTALNLMELFRISHLPIVNHQEFLGLISDTDIYDMNMAEEPIGNHRLSLLSPYVTENQHIFEVIDVASKLKLSVIPVLDDKKNYMGLITLINLTQNFAKTIAVDNPGGLLIMEMSVNDYSLSEIAQIVEGNDAKILSLYVSSSHDSTKLHIIIKINKTDLSPIIQTFLRYNYTINGIFSKDNQMDDFLDDRFDSFMRYLNV